MTAWLTLRVYLTQKCGPGKRANIMGKHQDYLVIILPQKPSNIKAFRGREAVTANSFSRPPPYDRLANPPGYEYIVHAVWCGFSKFGYRKVVVEYFYWLFVRLICPPIIFWNFLSSLSSLHLLILLGFSILVLSSLPCLCIQTAHLGRDSQVCFFIKYHPIDYTSIGVFNQGL